MRNPPNPWLSDDSEITLRDLFAAFALVADRGPYKGRHYGEDAHEYYQIADAMLQEREEGER